MDGSLVTIIVAVYNVSAYLPHCIDSVITQSHQRLDVLLIDDGSTDNSPRLCDEAAARDARVRVIHKPNQGLSAARNAGLDSACGEFVAFLDGDDWMETETIADLLEVAERGRADVVVAGYDVESVDAENHVIALERRCPPRLLFEPRPPDGQDIESVLPFTGYAWNKLTGETSLRRAATGSMKVRRS